IARFHWTQTLARASNPMASPAPFLRLGTRRSPLAMAQAEEARARLCAAHGWEESAIELVPVVASGDRIQDRPLAEIGGKALWTRELDQWLAEDRIDAAVHSLKDVETRRPDSLSLAAILPRADKRDVLLGAASLAALPQGATIGTSAPRRAAQALHARPDCRVVTFRGNVATRIAKLAAGEADATFLAAAGLARLGESGVGHPLDPADRLPAPAQGAIALECRAADTRVCELLAAGAHPPGRCSPRSAAPVTARSRCCASGTARCWRCGLRCSAPTAQSGSTVRRHSPPATMPGPHGSPPTCSHAPRRPSPSISPAPNERPDH